MAHTINNSLSQQHNTCFILLALLLSAIATSAIAAPQVISGVRNSSGTHHLNDNQLQQVQVSLRDKSGFVELRFDEQGTLRLGNRQHIQGGSATARDLLIAAVESLNLYELENHENSPDIAFARILESVDQLINEIGQRRTIFQVQLDFSDFKYLSGPREAKASFEIGIVLLHELVHGVLQLKDPNGAMSQIGDCDAHVNKMRRELALPERLYYHPAIRIVQLNGSRIVYAQLQFGTSQERSQYQIIWQASRVSPNAQNVAALEQGLVGPQHR